MEEEFDAKKLAAKLFKEMEAEKKLPLIKIAKDGKPGTKFRLQYEDGDIHVVHVSESEEIEWV